METLNMIFINLFNFEPRSHAFKRRIKDKGIPPACLTPKQKEIQGTQSFQLSKIETKCLVSF